MVLGPRFFPGTNEPGYPLEPGESVEDLDAVRGADKAVQFACYYGLYDLVRGQESSACRKARQDVIDEQCACLIAVEEHVVAARLRCEKSFGMHGVFDDEGETVRIGIGGERAVGTDPLGKCDGQGKCLELFGVGFLDRRESSVGLFLLGYDVQIGEAPPGKGTTRGNCAGPVERGIDNAHGARRCCAVVDAKGVEGFEIPVDHSVGNGSKQTARACRRFVDGLGDVPAFEGEDLREDAFVLRGDDLRTILPVDFETMVLLRIVAGGETQTRDAAESAHGIAQARSRLDRVEDVTADPVGSEHARRFKRKARSPLGDKAFDRFRSR